MIELGLALALGIGLGVVTGLPLGVVNLAVVEAAVRRGPHAAAGLGVGGALADLIHAGLAFGGVGRAVIGRPALATALHLGAGVALGVYATLLWRARTAPTTTDTDTVATATTTRPAGRLVRSVLVGVGLTLPNPAALGAWIAVAAAIGPPTLATGLTTAAGVGLGSAAWFVALARLAARGAHRRTAGPAMTRAVAVTLGVIGAAAIARGLS